MPDQGVASHFCRLRQFQQVEQGWSEVGKSTMFKVQALCGIDDDERHRVGSMCGMHTAGFGVSHGFDVAVISRNDHVAACICDGVGNLAQASIDGLDCL